MGIVTGYQGSQSHHPSFATGRSSGYHPRGRLHSHLCHSTDKMNKFTSAEYICTPDDHLHFFMVSYYVIEEWWRSNEPRILDPIQCFQYTIRRKARELPIITNRRGVSDQLSTTQKT